MAVSSGPGGAAARRGRGGAGDPQRERWAGTARTGHTCIVPGTAGKSRPSRVGVATSDLLACRAVISPLSALLVPLFVGGDPGMADVGSWLESARRAVSESTLVLRALLDAAPAAAALGVLIAPLPHPRPALADQVDALARLPGPQIAGALRASGRQSAGRSMAARAALGLDIARLAPTLARETDRVWRATFTAAWARVRPALHDETSRLSEDALRLGLGLTLSRTLPEVRFSVTGKPPQADPADLPGLLLLPVVGAAGTLISRSPSGPTLAHYSTAATTPNPGAASRVFGRTRAQLLTRLATPQSTSALARQLGLSTGTVSYHLLRLYRSGLLERSRDGHQVLYRLSARGRHLLDHPTTR